MQLTLAKPCPEPAVHLNHLEMDDQLGSAVPKWYAAYTLPRHEKAVAERLAYRQVESYLPLYKVLRRWNGRHIELDLPLFPGYVFVRLPFCERIKVLENPSVLRIISFNGQPAALPESEIASLRRSLEVRRAEPYPYLVAGKRIRITYGPLQGLEGTIIRRKGRLRMIVSIDSLQRAISVELDVADLKLAA